MGVVLLDMFRNHDIFHQELNKIHEALKKGLVEETVFQGLLDLFVLAFDRSRGLLKLFSYEVLINLLLLSFYLKLLEKLFNQLFLLIGLFEKSGKLIRCEALV